MFSYEFKIIKELKKGNIYSLKHLTFGQKIKLFILLQYLKKTDKILDLGCGTMWLTKYLRNNGYNCVGFALEKPADIVGDIKTYRFKKESFDVVIALEMIEHVDCCKEIKEILKPKGTLIISTPVPRLDWLCFFFEQVNLFQKRTSPHSNLFYLTSVPFKPVFTQALFGINQLGIFKK